MTRARRMDGYMSQIPYRFCPLSLRTHVFYMCHMITYDWLQIIKILAKTKFHSRKKARIKNRKYLNAFGHSQILFSIHPSDSMRDMCYNIAKPNLPKHICIYIDSVQQSFHNFIQFHSTSLALRFGCN